MRINFTTCAAVYRNDTFLQELYRWDGATPGIEERNQTLNYQNQITREGCRQVCGTGTSYYTWEEVSSTLTTWILPVVGTLLQAPFESNATRRTFLAIARWVGSPIVSLSYVLWNIKVSAKAALMVDMAVKFDEKPDRKTDFGSMRDSMYLLLVMNQYTLRPDVVERKKEAECLLRIALFSRDLQLTDTDKSLRQMRRILARELREMRRRGAVPVFVSILWFLFAFALSVEGAFGHMGQNTTAHDLALGCLLAWFPVLIMGSIVDRNPIAAEAIRTKLNALVDHVRHSIRNEKHRNHFINSFRDQKDFDYFKVRVDNVASGENKMEEFFEEFAGQARVRWHYGAAHPILSDIEDCYIAEKGRNWLADERDARLHLVLGPVNEEGLMWFDIREFWQVLSAIIIVGGSCGGAFVLSFFTPTVGLGCRSGGYTIFFSVALGLMFFEMTVWLVTSPYEVRAPWLMSVLERLRRYEFFKRWESSTQERWTMLQRRASSFSLVTENRLIRFIAKLAQLPPWKDKRAVRRNVTDSLEARFRRLRNMGTSKRWEIFFFRPVETFNTIWLIYIVLAQTFGWYKTCDCVTSMWAGGGGYLDFSKQDISNSKWVKYYWTAGTCLTAFVMMSSMFYITVEWCQQSFLSTEIYEDAMTGLGYTRDYRCWTYWFRAASRFISRFTFDPLESLGVKFGLIKSRQKTLVWTRKHHHDPDLSHQRVQPLVPLPRHVSSPSIELTDYSTVPHDESAIQDTPAMAHSLFPPAITTRRPRNESDASFTEPTLPIYEQYRRSDDRQSDERPSDDSHRPLIQRPSDVHRSRASSASRRTSGEAQRGGEDRRSSKATDGRSSSEYMLSPTSPLEEQSGFGGWLGLNTTVQSRQGYRRANSDPGSPPFEMETQAGEMGLGIDIGSGMKERVE
ncbi:hypothetical protein CC86DRAFT_318980 [Ophiobolus disseminans]|uniref:Uncharacterized protein n=1 Tax=Ophiobolus disseminans TaxID=1469910 RepID=A0A6A7A8T1_9PLEO|nr:hypothetical protein CC86DRAFT_318980 [Ophiobolus disseminans]